MRCLMVLLVTAIAVSGCSSPVSPNLELAAIRSVGDVSVSSILDNSSDDALDKRKADMDKYITAVADFVGEGNPENLVQAALLDHLKKIQEKLKIPSWLGPLVEDLVESLKDEKVDDQVAKIGKRNVLRIVEFLYGAQQGIKRYRPDIREMPPATPPKDPVSSTP